MSLFVLASKDGWVNIMYNGLDAVAVDQQVRRLPCKRTFFTFLGLVRQKHALTSCFRHLPQTKSPFQGPSESFAHLFARYQGHAWSMQGGAAVAVQCTSVVILTLYSVWISQQVFIYL